IPAMLSVSETLKGLTGSTTFNVVKTALPITGRFLNDNLNINPTMPIKDSLLEKLAEHEDKLNELLAKDTDDYLASLEKSKISFKLKNKK
ncbi:MAG: hypothetical protein ACKO96_33735, partial [Flammeovirgaceae bacterium]